MSKEIPLDGRVRVNVAMQVAGIAAQVSAALRANNQARHEELEHKLALAQSQLDPLDSPPGLVAFIDVMRGLLRGDDVAARAGGLPSAYRAVYEQVACSRADPQSEGELTVRQVMDEMAHNVITVMRFGTFDQRQQMIDVLSRMQRECAQLSYLSALSDLVKAARVLLEGGDPSALAAQLKGPFRDKWDQILSAIEE